MKSEDVSVFVPYGVGTYVGLEDVAEFFGISFLGLNHGFWKADFDTPEDLTKRARFELSKNGRGTWAQRKSLHRF